MKNTLKTALLVLYMSGVSLAFSKLVSRRFFFCFNSSVGRGFLDKSTCSRLTTDNVRYSVLHCLNRQFYLLTFFAFEMSCMGLGLNASELHEARDYYRQLRRENNNNICRRWLLSRRYSRYLVLYRGSRSQSRLPPCNGYPAAIIAIIIGAMIALVGSLPNMMRYRIEYVTEMSVPGACLSSKYHNWWASSDQIKKYDLVQPTWWNCHWERINFWMAGALPPPNIFSSLAYSLPSTVALIITGNKLHRGHIGALSELWIHQIAILPCIVFLVLFKVDF
uniref:GPI mannosyltransferase 2 n=1 Tax=Heterorhabditis bacteriophora TaxID=37862 RepID=A0A1I7WXV8_HETBA